MLPIEWIVQAVLDESQEEKRGGENFSHDGGRKPLQLAASYVEQRKESAAVDGMFTQKVVWLSESE